MGRAVLEGGRPANIHEFCFQAAKRSDMECVQLQGCLFLIVRNGISKSRNVDIIAVTSRKRVDLLMFTYSVFRVRNVEIYAVLSSNEVDLLMLRNRVFRLRFVQIWAVPSLKDFDLLILKNCVLRLGNVHILLLQPFYVGQFSDFVCVFRLRNVKYG